MLKRINYLKKVDIEIKKSDYLSKIDIEELRR